MTAALVALSLGVAHAQDKRPSMSVTVSDLDLSKPKDAQRLYDRIYTAAEVVCGGGPLVTFGPFPNTQFMACRDTVIDAAVRQIHAPLVTALRPGIQDRAQVAAR